MRISSKGTKFYVDNGTEGDEIALSAVTKAKPAVATAAAALPAEAIVGAVVQVFDTGWRSLDNRPFEIAAVAAQAVTLHDSDTSKETAALGAAPHMHVVNWSEACMATLTFTSPAGSEIDVTTLCDEARETVSGMPAISTWQATGFWDKDDAVQSRLRDLYRSGVKEPFKVVFNDGSGLAFVANVNSYDVRAGVDQAVAITVGGTMSGPISFLGTVDAAMLANTIPSTLAAPPPPPPPEPAPAPAA